MRPPVLGLLLSACRHALAQDVRVETQQQARVRAESDAGGGDHGGGRGSRARRHQPGFAHSQAEDVYVFDPPNPELLEQRFPRP